MGIYDRDYYRDESPNVVDWLLPAGHVCKWLFAIYVGVLLVQLLTRPSTGEQVAATIQSGERFGWFTDAFTLDVERVQHGEVWRLVTYAFMHVPGAFLQFIFGMWFLWCFGPDMEQLYGSRSFLAFYLLAILATGVTFTLVSLGRGEPGFYMWSSEVLAALLVLCAIHFPNRVIMILFIIPVPIWILAGLYILWNLYHALGGLGSQAIVLSQLASAGFAVGFYKYKRDHGSLLSDLFGGLLRWRPGRSQRQLKLYRPETEQPREPVPVAAPAARPMDEHFEAKLDAVLEKIARTGKESLSAEEQRILLQASELYKKKRT